MSNEFPVRLFGTLATSRSRAEIAALFAASSGWRVRESGWSEFELITDAADLYVDAESPMLIHGSVASESVVDRILEILEKGEVAYAMEWYADNHELLGNRAWQSEG